MDCLCFVVKNQISSFAFTKSVKNACAIRGFAKISEKEMRSLAFNTSELTTRINHKN